MMPKWKLAGFSLIALAATLPGHALAQQASTPAAKPAPDNTDSDTKLTDIVVTAERRTSSEQKTAASISVRAGNELLASGKSELAQILEDVPGVAVNSSNDLGQQGLNITIRGVRNNSDTISQPTAPSATTAVYTDGVYEGIGSNYDISQVEVLRGPQGTLYGRSATSGVVAFHTTDPVLDTITGFVSGETGSYDLTHTTGALNIPLGPIAALRVSGDYYGRDGYYNDTAGRLDHYSGRAKLLVKPSDRLTLLFGAAYEQLDEGSGGATAQYNLGQTNLYYANTPNFLERSRQFQVWGQADWDIGFAKITYVSSYRHYQKGLDGRDSTYFLFEPEQDSQAINQIPSDKVYSNELRIASSDSSPIKWIAGAIAYTDHASQYDAIYLIANPVDPAVVSNVAKRVSDRGLFAEVTVPLGSKTRVTGGIRYDWTSVDVTATQSTNLAVVAGVPVLPTVSETITPEDGGSARFHNFTFKGRVEHDLTPANMLYASVSRGFLPGDVEVGAGAAPVGSPFYGSGLAVPVSYVFQGSSLTAYEIGSKNRFLGDRLQVNGDVFYYDYQGYQQVVLTIPGNPASSQLFGVPVWMFGGELELLYRLARNTTLNLSYSHITARIHDAPEAFTAVVAGNRLPGVVPNTVTFGIDHSIAVGDGSRLRLHADGRYLSATQIGVLTPTDLLVGNAFYANQGGVFVGDLSATLDIGKSYSLTAYVRNITDNRYNTTDQIYTTLARVTQYDPRTIGVVATVRF